jgi:phosphopantetheinyl transferase
MESNKKKVLNMSTFLIPAAQQRKISLISASRFFLRGHLTPGLLSHQSRPIPLQLRFDVGHGKKPALQIVKLRS